MHLYLIINILLNDHSFCNLIYNQTKPLQNALFICINIYKREKWRSVIISWK